MKYILLAFILLIPSVAIAADDIPNCDSINSNGAYGAMSYVAPSNNTKSGGSYAMERMNRLVKGYDDLAKSVSKDIRDKNSKDSDFLNDCITGINTSIFSSDISFSAIWDSLKQTLMKKTCSFTKQVTGEAISMALSKVQLDLPGGIGSVGASGANVAGVQLYSTGTSSLANSGISQKPSTTTAESLAESITSGASKYTPSTGSSFFGK